MFFAANFHYFQEKLILQLSLAKFDLNLSTKATMDLILVAKWGWDCLELVKSKRKCLSWCFDSIKSHLMTSWHFYGKFPPKINLRSSTQVHRNIVLVPKVVFSAVDGVVYRLSMAKTVILVLFWLQIAI